MSSPLELHLEAEREIEAAVAWYEERRVGLGLEFVAALHRTLDSIQEQPLRFGVWHAPFRKAVFRQFPYVVFYTLEPGRIAIMAVAHSRRRPGYWLSRRLANPVVAP